ncbi:hypothetical protein BDF14DRAFT_1951079 [Spinellus fusiger]|nr:hypothetical protein BDF14DRAFT_1951079 [Spinellus fusiger]
MSPSVSHLPVYLRDSRCILHIDLDCFYCQVEERRLDIAPGIPCAVRQWNSLIAVNYAARKKGVQRHCTVEEAKTLCPDIQLFHVATYAANDKEPHYYSHPDRKTHKVSLDVYRNASKSIFKIFSKYNVPIQKIGLDEAFFDVTEIVNKRLKEKYLENRPDLIETWDDLVCGVPIDWDAYGVTIQSNEEQEGQCQEMEETKQWASTTWCDLQLAIGAELALQIRKEVYDELKYTSSAGIAHYKSVAKLCSSRNKPDKQTVLRNNCLLDFMREIPFAKIRHLGGRLGKEVENTFKAEKASDLWQYDIQVLQKKMGHSAGTWLYNVVRGIDIEEVSNTKAPQSVMAIKSFYPGIYNTEELERWLRTLSSELHSRILTHLDEYKALPKKLVLYYQGASGSGSKTKSLTLLNGNDFKDIERLLKEVIKLYKSMGCALPCHGFSLKATGMSPAQLSLSHSIAKFLIQPSKQSSRSHKEELPHSVSTMNETSSSEPLSLSSKKDKDQSQAISINDASSKKDLELFWICDQCHERIDSQAIEEHTDYHFAMELQSLEELSSTPQQAFLAAVPHVIPETSVQNKREREKPTAVKKQKKSGPF